MALILIGWSSFHHQFKYIISCIIMALLIWWYLMFPSVWPCDPVPLHLRSWAMQLLGLTRRPLQLHQRQQMLHRSQWRTSDEIIHSNGQCSSNDLSIHWSGRVVCTAHTFTWWYHLCFTKHAPWCSTIFQDNDKKLLRFQGTFRVKSELLSKMSKILTSTSWRLSKTWLSTCSL